jgi:hypothetical protein
MVQRQYFNLPISELERIFGDKRHHHDVLTSLITELSHRTVPRAKKLQKRVLQALSVEKTKPMPQRKQQAKSKDSSELLLTIEEHRRVATHLREEHDDWTAEERKVALEFAKHHEFLADLIERRSKKEK